MKEMVVTKRVVDGKVAVLFSPGFGAGWSTWSYTKDNAIKEFMVFDEALVELVQRNAGLIEVEAFLERKGITDMYLGGWSGVKIEWLPQGTRFVIQEYDGSESILLADDLVLTA